MVEQQCNYCGKKPGSVQLNEIQKKAMSRFERNYHIKNGRYCDDCVRGMDKKIEEEKRKKKQRPQKTSSPLDTETESVQISDIISTSESSLNNSENSGTRNIYDTVSPLDDVPLDDAPDDDDIQIHVDLDDPSSSNNPVIAPRTNDDAPIEQDRVSDSLNSNNQASYSPIEFDSDIPFEPIPRESSNSNDQPNDSPIEFGSDTSIESIPRKSDSSNGIQRNGKKRRSDDESSSSSSPKKRRRNVSNKSKKTPPMRGSPPTRPYNAEEQERLRNMSSEERSSTFNQYRLGRGG